MCRVQHVAVFLRNNHSIPGNTDHHPAHRYAAAVRHVVWGEIPMQTTKRVDSTQTTTQGATPHGFITPEETYKHSLTKGCVCFMLYDTCLVLRAQG